MSYYVIIRGPLGVGKSTVSKRLAKDLRAKYIPVDRILDEYDFWYSGRLSEFLRVNAVVAQRAVRLLNKGTSVVIDGNFYWKTQIRDLKKRLDHREPRLPDLGLPGRPGRSGCLGSIPEHPCRGLSGKLQGHIHVHGGGLGALGSEDPVVPALRDAAYFPLVLGHHTYV